MLSFLHTAAARGGLAASLLLTTACGVATTPTAPNALTQSGFEEALGWGGTEQPSLTTAQAHTGRVAVLVSPQVPFGYTFARTLDELGVGTGTHHLELTGWVLRTAAGSTAQLVVQVDASATDETKVYYTSLPLADAVSTFGQWQEVRLPVELPANALGTNRLKIYLWNNKGTSPAYLDDVSLRRVATK